MMHMTTTLPNNHPLLRPAGASVPDALVRSRREVMRLLTAFIEQDVPLSVRYLNADITITTSLIFIDEESNTLLLMCPPEWELIIKAADSIMVGCVFEGAKIEFQGGSCAKVDLDGTPVVGMPIPEFLWRFQRRRDPRQSVSGLKIMLNMGFLEAEAEIVDLSLGGVGLINCGRELKFAQGEMLRGCAITLPGVGRIPVNLVVQHRREVYGADGLPVTRMGCQFVGLRESARQMIAHYLRALSDT